MAQKTIKVEFVEQSKAVTAQVKVELIDDEGNVDGKAILQEAKEIFDSAKKYSEFKTMEKAGVRR